MRITHVVTAFPRSAEDPITPWLVELVRRQRERGLDARVLAPAYRGQPAVPLGAIPVRRFRYAPASWETLTHEETVPDRLRRKRRYALLLPGYLAAGIRVAWQEGRAAAAANIEHVAHVHWPMPHVLFGVAMRVGGTRRGLSRGGRTAIVCSYYSAELNWVERRMRWLLPFLRWSVRTADAVTAISSSTGAAVRRLGAESVRIIPYGSALDEDGSAPAREAFGPRAGGDEVPTILFVGRLVERKGVEVLVRAVEVVCRTLPLRLVIVGEGEWEARIQDVVAECGVSPHVRFAGRVSTAQLQAEYEASDVVVLPAVVDSKGDTEGLGVVLLEALRFERPVIASRAGGIVDIVRDGETGWLVPPGDAPALAARIEAVVSNPEASRAVARAGREWGREGFAWGRVLAETEAAYAEALKHAAPDV